MTEQHEKHDYMDDLKDLINGGWIMLFIFGLTICGLAITSLVAALFTSDPAKITMLSKIFDTLIGFIAGAYTTMWNNQHFKYGKDGKDGNGNGVSLTYTAKTPPAPVAPVPPTTNDPTKGGV